MTDKQPAIFLPPDQQAVHISVEEPHSGAFKYATRREGVADERSPQSTSTGSEE